MQFGSRINCVCVFVTMVLESIRIFSKRFAGTTIWDYLACERAKNTAAQLDLWSRTGVCTEIEFANISESCVRRQALPRMFWQRIGLAKPDSDAG